MEVARCGCETVLLTPLYSGMVIDQTRTGAFRFRTIDEIAQKRATLQDVPGEPAQKRESDSDIDKKGSQEFVETV